MAENNGLESKLNSFKSYIKKAFATGLIASSLLIGYSRSQTPGLPINYWDSPICDAGCDQNTGVFKDGLHLLDNKLVEFMLDCNGDGSKETNVNKSAFQTTLMSGAYDIDVYADDGVNCGYIATNASKNKGDARIDGLLAYPRNLPLIDPGASIQQRLDAYSVNLTMPSNTEIDWTAINEADGYDILRGDVSQMNAAGGLQGASVLQIACYISNLSISGTPELIQDPSVGQAFFYLVRPRNSFEKGNYGLGKNDLPRPNPTIGDCL